MTVSIKKGFKFTAKDVARNGIHYYHKIHETSALSAAPRVSSCGDFAPKWRFQRPSGARLSVAIRHLKGGDFGKLVEKPQKVAFLSQTWRF